MDRPYTGGCACGALRYEIDAEPMMMLDCQCRQCQHDSGTGHASHLTFPAGAARIEGKATHWDLVGDGGTRKRRAFCPVCGSPVAMTFPDMPDYVLVRAGSLDEPGRFKPQMVTWTAAGHAWDRIDPELPAFETMPPR